MHVKHEPEVLRLGPDERVGGACGLAVGEPDRGGLRVAAVRGGGSVGVLPGLFRYQAEAGRHQLHGLGQAGGAGDVTGLQVLFGAFAVKQRPRMTGSGAGREPGCSGRGAVRRIGDVAVAVAVGAAGRLAELTRLDAVAVPTRAGGGLAFQHRVDHLERVLHGRVGCGQLAQPGQLEEARVDHVSLVHVGQAAIAQVVGVGHVRVPGWRQPDEVAGGVGAGGGHRPPFDIALVVVGGGQVQVRAGRVARGLSQVRRSDQSGDLGGDVSRGEAGVFLPALGAVGRAVVDDEVGVRADVVLVEGHVPGQPGFPGHQQRVGVFVDLHQPERVRGNRSVEQRVAREAAVRLLGPVVQELHHRAGAGHVAVGEQPGEGLVAVPGEHLPVGPPRMRRGGRDRLTPGVGRRGDEGAQVGLVLIGLQHVGGQPVLGSHRGVGGGGQPGQRRRRLLQGAVVAAPSRDVPCERAGERLGGGLAGRRDRRVVAGPEPEGEGERLPRSRVDQRGQRDVAVLRRLVLIGQRVAGIKLAEAVAGGADEPGGFGEERLAGGERPVHGGRERPRTGRRRGVGGYQRRRGRVDRGVIGTCVA